MEKLFSIMIDVISAIFAVLFLTLALLAVNHYQFNSSLIQEYKNNWETKPILDIVTVPQDTCPDGYDPLISNQFPGIEEGCDCTDSTDPSFEGKIFKNTCDDLRLINDCHKVKDQKDIPLIKWKGKSLCTLRMKSNYWDLLAVSNASCPQGMRKCGILDSSTNSMCVSTMEKCPINKIEILPSTKSPSFRKFSSVKLENNYTLYYTNEKIDSPVLVEIVAGEVPICAHPFEGLLGENQYILNKRRGSPKCLSKISNQTTDNRFESLDSQKTLSFYDENSVSDVLIWLSQYNMPKEDNTVTLYMINYFGWNKTCLNREEYNGDKLVNPEKEVNKYYGNAYSLAVISLIHFIFILLSIVIYKLLLENYLKERTILIIDVIHIILLLVMFIMSICISTSTTSIISPYQKFISNQCSDQITNSALEIFYLEFSSVKGYLLPISIMTMIEIGLIILYYIWTCLFKKNNT